MNYTVINNHICDWIVIFYHHEYDNNFNEYGDEGNNYTSSDGRSNDYNTLYNLALTVNENLLKDTKLIGVNLIHTEIYPTIKNDASSSSPPSTTTSSSLSPPSSSSKTSSSSLLSRLLSSSSSSLRSSLSSPASLLSSLSFSSATTMSTTTMNSTKDNCSQNQQPQQQPQQQHKHVKTLYYYHILNYILLYDKIWLIQEDSKINYFDYQKFKRLMLSYYPYTSLLSPLIFEHRVIDYNDNDNNSSSNRESSSSSSSSSSSNRSRKQRDCINNDDTKGDYTKKNIVDYESNFKTTTNTANKKYLDNKNYDNYDSQQQQQQQYNEFNKIYKANDININSNNLIIDSEFFYWYLDIIIRPLIQAMNILATDYGLDYIICKSAENFRKLHYYKNHDNDQHHLYYYNTFLIHPNNYSSSSSSRGGSRSNSRGRNRSSDKKMNINSRLTNSVCAIYLDQNSTRSINNLHDYSRDNNTHHVDYHDNNEKETKNQLYDYFFITLLAKKYYNWFEFCDLSSTLLVPSKLSSQ